MGFPLSARRRYPGGSAWMGIFASVAAPPHPRHTARPAIPSVSISRRTSVHISFAAHIPRASLSAGLTQTQLCAAFFDKPGYPVAHGTFKPAFSTSAPFRKSIRFLEQCWESVVFDQHSLLLDGSEERAGSTGWLTGQPEPVLHIHGLSVVREVC